MREVDRVFSGGTSLSKGFGLIKRFSEDIDFKLILPEVGLSRAARSWYRHQAIGALRGGGDWAIDEGDILVGNESRFFSCLVTYPARFAAVPVLRPQIKLEVSFTPPVLPAAERPLHSFVAEARRDDPEVPAIECVAPAETAADKLSALTWRVLDRRDNRDNDPTLIRHLHDLAALETYAREHARFPHLLRQLLVRDASRGGASHDLPSTMPGARLDAALELLHTDQAYEREYDRFVAAMCYSAERETPAFGFALEAARRLRECLSGEGGHRGY